MPLRDWRHGIRRILDDAKRQRKKGNPAKYVALPPARSKKGNEKRETQQNPMPLPPARSEKGNEKQRNPRNPLPLKQVWLPKGNQKRETQQNPMPLPPARSEKGNQNRGNPRNPLPHSCFPQKGKKRKGSNPKKAPNNRAAAPWCGCPILYSLSNYCCPYFFKIF